MTRRTTLPWLVVIILLSDGAASAQSASTSATAEQESIRLAPVGAAMVPGILLHGAGAYVAGDHMVAKRLLITEGVGLGLVGGGIVGLAFTGASRQYSAPLIATTLTGVGLFVGTWLADLYGVSMPVAARGVPRSTLPRFELALGTSYRYDPRAATDALITPSARVSIGDFILGGSGQLAPSTSTARLRADVRYRVLRETRRGSYLDILVALTTTHLGDDDVNATSFEFQVPARLDLLHVGRILRGGFAELSLGGLVTTLDFDRNDSRGTDGALMGRVAVGAYLGDGDGEVCVYYDHRRDTLAGGALLGGVSAGFVGYGGLAGTWFPTRHVGGTVTVELGSALLIGAGVTMRFGEVE